MRGDMELPLTRRHRVDSGFGHHSMGAANMESAGTSARSTLSPSWPNVAAWTGRSGTATRLAFLSELVVLPPARTKCTWEILLSAKRRRTAGYTRVTSESRRPARFQKNQQS